MVKFLIEKGANLDLENKAGWTPLTKAIDCNKQEIIEFLIDKGADLNLIDTRVGRPSAGHREGVCLGQPSAGRILITG